MTYLTFWPDSWYAKFLVLGLVTYAIHWPIAYYIDRRLGITGKKWHKTIAGTAPLGQAVMVMTIYFIFVTPPFLEDALRGIVMFLKVIGGIKLIVLAVFLSSLWSDIVEGNDARTFFVDHRIPSSNFPIILYVPGIFFLRLVWFSVMHTFVGKGPSILCRGPRAQNGPSSVEDFDTDKHLPPSFNYFFPNSRLCRFGLSQSW